MRRGVLNDTCWLAPLAILLAVAGHSRLAMAAGEGPTAIPVTTAVLAEIRVFPERQAPATAVTLNDTKLDAEITGVISTIDVQVGDRVSSGQVVARLDCEPHRIEVARAQAALEAGRSTYAFSERQLDNAAQLAAKRSISQEEHDKREADARTLKAELDRLQAALDAALLSQRKCSILAPLDAVVIERIASVGDYAVPGTPILRLLDDVNIEIAAKVQEQDLDSLQQAREIAFVSRDRSYPVALRTILPLMETRLRTYEVRLLFSGARASPGETGRLRWTIARGEVPAELIVKRGQDFGIFVLDGERASFVPLAQARPGQPAPIDLPGKARIITDGRHRLEDGDLISLH